METGKGYTHLPTGGRVPSPQHSNPLTGRSRSASLDGGPVKALRLPKGSSGPNWICGPFRNSPNLDSGFLGCPLPIPFHLDGLKLAQASSFYSRLLSAGKDLTTLGGGAGRRRRISNYRAEVGISGRGTALKGRPTWHGGRLDREGCPGS